MGSFLIFLGLVSGFAFSPVSIHGVTYAPEEVREIQIVREVQVTAYSSTPDQTDSTPFITASGTRTRDGIVATNFLPIGTRIQIPELFGKKVFVVEDRMHPRKKNFVDVWMPSRSQALRFGIHETKIVVLN